MTTLTRSAIAGLAVFVFACDLSRPETHLIPNSYRGDVYILTGFRSGTASRREGLAKVFEIPATGILVTRDLPSSGWHATTYYYVDRAGVRHKLRYEPSTIPRTLQNMSDQSGIAWFARTGQINSADLPCSIKFERYYVGTPAHLLSRTTDDVNAEQLRLEDFARRNHLCP